MRTRKQFTTSNLKKKIHPATTVHYFWNVAGAEMGIDEKSKLSKN